MVGWLAAGVLLALLGWWIGSRYWNPPPDRRSVAYLREIAGDINRSVPVMIDAETELLPTEAAAAMLIYNYRLVKYTAARLDREKFAAAAKQRLTQGACSRPETRDGFLKEGVTLRYSYFDKDKQHVATIDVTPSDCGF
jgi:hypothetical protein